MVKAAAYYYSIFCICPNLLNIWASHLPSLALSDSSVLFNHSVLAAFSFSTTSFVKTISHPKMLNYWGSIIKHIISACTGTNTRRQAMQGSSAWAPLIIVSQGVIIHHISAGLVSKKARSHPEHMRILYSPGKWLSIRSRTITRQPNLTYKQAGRATRRRGHWPQAPKVLNTAEGEPASEAELQDDRWP